MATTLKSLDTLQSELDVQTLKFMELAPMEIMEILGEKIKELAGTEIVEKSTKVGDKAEKFSLESIDGSLVKSKSLLSKGPLVVTFFRGDWCAYCNLALRAMDKALPDIKKKGASLIAVSPQITNFSTKEMQDFTYNFPVLLDKENKLAKQFKVAFTLDKEVQRIYGDLFDIHVDKSNGDDSFILPLPATFVIDTDGTVVYSFVECNPGTRAEPQAIIEAIPESPPQRGPKRRSLRELFRPKFLSFLPANRRSSA